MTMKLIPTTNQQAFDMVVAHLKIQKLQAIDGTSCRYRDLNGRKCALGCMIADADYEEGVDKNGMSLRSAMNHGWITVDKGVDVELLEELQRCHDVGDNWSPGGYGYENWTEFMEIADTWNLDPVNVPKMVPDAD